MTTVLAIDQGTSGTKATVVDGAGQVIGLSEISIRPDYLPGGGVEQNPQQLFDSVVQAGRLAITAAGGADIDVVSFANQGESVLAWNPTTGDPLSPIGVWQDRRSESIVDELAGFAESIGTHTGLVLDPYFSAPKMAWLRRNVTRDGVVTTTDTWIVHRLTGEFVTDASTASRSLILNLDSGEWDRSLLEHFGLEDEPLPRITGSDAIVGTTSVFGGDIPVAGLVVDQQAALVAQDCIRAGEAKCTFGTGAFLLAHTGSDAPRSKAGLSTSIAWRTGGRDEYCLDGQVYTAASAVRWLANLGFIEHAADIDRVAAADSNGVFCIPALAGLAAPWWRPDAKASLHGVTLATEKEHIVRATLEGIAAQVAEVVASMAVDLGQPLHRLRVDGGLTQSQVLMQSVADLTQIPVDLYPSQHATPLGSAALARMAMEPGMALSEAIIPWQPTQSYTPQWSRDRATAFLQAWAAASEIG